MAKPKQPKQIRAAISLEGDGVQHGPDGAPIAFRIWRAGENVTDHGVHVLTPKSVEALLFSQEARGNLFSVDINHLSLDKTAPLENQKAVGFFRIAEINGDLWAIECEWTDTVRPGLAARPPEWRFHSPAYQVHPDTGEILSLTNLALTNNPATHHVTALAVRGATQGNRMTYEEAMAALDGDDADKKAAAKAAIKAAFGDDEDKPKDDDKEAKKASEDGDKAPEGAKAAADSDEEKAPESKKESVTATIASLDKTVREQGAELAQLRKERDDKERATVMATREMSKELATTLASMPLGDVKRICAGLPPKKAADPVAAQRVTATRGDGQGAPGSALPPTEKAKLDEAMGLKSVHASVRHEGVHQILPVLSPEQARAILAAKAKKEGV